MPGIQVEPQRVCGALFEQVAYCDSVAKRLAHFSALCSHKAHVRPELHWLLKRGYSLQLRKVRLMMRVHELTCSAVDVIRSAKACDCHRGVLHVPPWYPAVKGCIKKRDIQVFACIPQQNVLWQFLGWRNVQPAVAKVLPLHSCPLL